MPTYLCLKVSRSGDRTCIVHLDLKCILFTIKQVPHKLDSLRVFVPSGLATPAGFKSFIFICKTLDTWSGGLREWPAEAHTFELLVPSW